MADTYYKVKDSELTSIANAIRTKAGNNASLEFPTGFVSGIAGIDTYQSMYADVYASYTLMSDTLKYVIQKKFPTNYTFINDTISTIGPWAFTTAGSIYGVSCASVAIVCEYAFSGCKNLRDLTLPETDSFESCAVCDCSWIASLSFPRCVEINQSAFQNCSRLSQMTIRGDQAHGIYTDAFERCLTLRSLTILNESEVCTLHGDAFASTPITGYSAHILGYGSIYVPSSLVSAYQSATNWASISSRITAIPE